MTDLLRGFFLPKEGSYEDGSMDVVEAIIKGIPAFFITFICMNGMINKFSILFGQRSKEIEKMVKDELRKDKYQ